MKIETNHLTSQRALLEWCDRHHSQKLVAIDTEFERRRTFFPILCLVQLATKDSICCIDTVAIKNLEPLVTFLNDSRRTLVFHAARQDIEVLMPIGLKPSATIFDTQVAASFCGFRDQIGYADLVFELLDTKIDKSSQKTNWLKRPLSDTQLAYAAEDVRYLFDISDILKNNLTSLNRLQWVFEECHLISLLVFDDSPYDSWKRLTNINGLSINLAQKACQIAVWRELLAREVDAPRNWILSDKNIKDLVTTSIASRAELALVFEKSEYLQGKDITGLYEILAGTKNYKDVSYSRPCKLTKDQKEIIERAIERIRFIAKNFDLEPSLIATTKELKHLISCKTSDRLLSDWRRELLKSVYQEFELTSN